MYQLFHLLISGIQLLFHWMPLISKLSSEQMLLKMKSTAKETQCLFDLCSLFAHFL